LNEEDEVEEDEDESPILCGMCRGSGEGMYPGTICGFCHGTGVSEDDEE
jgi:hypothetical protein